VYGENERYFGTPTSIFEDDYMGKNEGEEDPFDRILKMIIAYSDTVSIAGRLNPGRPDMSA
jgi:hypothetical protein